MRSIRTRALAGLLATAVVLGVVACGGDSDDGDGGSADASSDGGAKVGIALGGPRNDRGFYQSAFEGLEQAAESHDLDVSVVDSLEDPQARLEAMTNLSADNELVIGGGAEFIEAANNLATQFPDVEYVVLTGVADDSNPNVHAYVPRQGVPAYIAGAVAAQISKSEHVGFVGGLEIPPTDASNAGFEAGAEAQLPGVEYSTTTVGTFNDPAKAKQAAKAQLDAGADSVYAFLDAGTPGVVQAIDEAGKDATVFAAIAPRCEESPAFVGTAVLDVGAVVVRLVEDWQSDQLPKGTQFFGVETPEIQRFELCPDHATPELEKLVDDLTEQLNNEEIKLPEEI